MRILALPLLALLFLCSPLLAQVESAPAGDPAPDLQIPAVLNKTIRTEKVRPGDEVRLDLAEAILVGHGLVMPEGTHLYGHILESEPVTASSGSRLSIKVERAEWRHKQMPLHAFISGLGVRKMNLGSTDPQCDASSMMSERAQQRVPTSPSQPDCSSRGVDQSVLMRDYNLQKLQLRTRPDGSTTLISKEKNIQLPGGTLIMLHNVPASKEDGEQSEASLKVER